MSATVNVNGRITPECEAVISVFDHGFLYGEGIYETMRTYHGRPFLFNRHVRRLRRSARARSCSSMAVNVPANESSAATIARR